MNDPAALRERAAELAGAMRLALRAFEHGRFDNRAATIHLSDRALSAADYHFFVEADGRTRLQAALGAEGAHRSAQSVPADTAATPQRRLAMQWLRCQAAFDAPDLASISTSFANLIRNFSDGSPARTARVLEVIDGSVRQCRRGQPLPALLDDVASALQSVRDPG